MRSVKTALIVSLLLIVPIAGEEKVDDAVVSRIKVEGFQHSQVMDTLSWLSDVYGPRLTGSPPLRQAAEWARERLTKWGVDRAELEPYGPIGRGWALERFSIEMTEPQYMRIT